MLSLVTGAIAGTMGGLLGIGGGAILVPMLTGILKMAQHQAHGTSLMVAVFLALSGALGYAWQGHVDWPLTLQLGAGAAVGAVIGAKLMMRVPAAILRQGFGALLILVALRLLLG
ncbi:MAG: sulfite exporter TauE/SafE family protein [Chloroflexota bacterium]|nr:sulfite exporter TauE/SafE family protein [Chloroflexota bacterium]